MSRMRTVLTMVAVLSLLSSQGDALAAPTSDGVIVEVPATELLMRLERGKVTSVALVNAYLQRIERVDRAGPRLNAFITINPDALAEARALDAERKAGKLRGPLH